MKKNKTARECALFLLEYGDCTEKEMRQKLRDREYGPEEIEATLSFLKEYHYIDDAEYAEKYIRVYSSKKSTRQIRCGLEKKGIARNVIEQHLEESPIDEEKQIYAFLLKKGCRPGEERMDAADFRKLVAALGRRGFSYDSIRRVTDRMGEEDSWNS